MWCMAIYGFSKHKDLIVKNKEYINLIWFFLEFYDMIRGDLWALWWGLIDFFSTMI